MNVRRIVMKCKLRTAPRVGLEYAVVNNQRHRSTRVLVLGSDVNRMSIMLRDHLMRANLGDVIVDLQPKLAISDNPSIFNPARMLELHQRFVNDVYEPIQRYSKDSPRRDPYGPCTCGKRKRYRNCCGRGRK